MNQRAAKQRTAETATGTWCILGGASATATLLFLLQWRKINICLTVADHWEIEWISSGSQISSSFFSLLKRLDPKADVPPRHGPSGWRVQAGLGVGVRVKFRGWRSDEGQGYGRVGVMVRSKYPTPLGQHLSGHCLPLRPVRDVIWHSATILEFVALHVKHGEYAAVWLELRRFD